MKIVGLRTTGLPCTPLGELRLGGWMFWLASPKSWACGFLSDPLCTPLLPPTPSHTPGRSEAGITDLSFGSREGQTLAYVHVLISAVDGRSLESVCTSRIWSLANHPTILVNIFRESMGKPDRSFPQSYEIKRKWTFSWSIASLCLPY